jgi:hypothetical protein
MVPGWPGSERSSPAALHYFLATPCSRLMFSTIGHFSTCTFPPWLLISALQSAPAFTMDRLRDLATRTRRVDYHFRIPKSLSNSFMPHKPTDPDEHSNSDSNNDARSIVDSSSATDSMKHNILLYGNLGTPISLQSLLDSDQKAAPTPNSSGTRPTPAHPLDKKGALKAAQRRTSSTNTDRRQPKMKAKANQDQQYPLRLKGDSASSPDHPKQVEQNLALFDQIHTNIAQDDVIANSGRELYHRVNDCARDYIEAKQMVERREHEIAAISAKIEAMQATMDKATKHLHSAQAIAGDAIDSSVAEQFRLKEQNNLTNILIGMSNAIAKGSCHDWPRDKVNKYLEVRSLQPSPRAGSPRSWLIIQNNPPSSPMDQIEKMAASQLSFPPGP